MHLAQMKTAIAQYILNLHSAASMTHRSEDRPQYAKLLADAAALLALAETGAPLASIHEAVQNHERLWGMMWLVDDVYKNPSSAWQEVKQCIA
jgi:hypothetical protein